MTKPWAWYQTSSLVVMVGGMLSLLSFITFSQAAVAGYGYGYGYGTCTVKPPFKLQAVNQQTAHRVRLSWTAPDFLVCGTSLDHYELTVVRGGLPVYSRTTTNTTAFIHYGALPGPGKYSYQVRAYSSDGNVTAWSTRRVFTL